MTDLHIGEYASFQYWDRQSYRKDGYICAEFPGSENCVWFRPADVEELPRKWKWRNNNTEFATSIEHLYNFRDYGDEQPEENSLLDVSDLL